MGLSLRSSLKITYEHKHILKKEQQQQQQNSNVYAHVEHTRTHCSTSIRTSLGPKMYPLMSRLALFSSGGKK